MPIDNNMAGIINTAIGALPGILAMFRTNYSNANPGAPPLTDEDVAKALREACDASISKTDAWLAAHPA